MEKYIMGTMHLHLPSSLQTKAMEFAAREGISIDQLVAAALADKMSALMSDAYLDSRAKRGNKERFRTALSLIRNTRSK